MRGWLEALGVIFVLAWLLINLILTYGCAASTRDYFKFGSERDRLGYLTLLGVTTVSWIANVAVIWWAT